jgi:hypothetical protein
VQTGVEALRYMPEGRGFDSRCVLWDSGLALTEMSIRGLSDGGGGAKGWVISGHFSGGN